MTRLRWTAYMPILLLLLLCVCSIQSRVSTPMTISTRRSKARHVAEAARLRAESFVISGPDTVRQGKVGEIKTGADRELKRNDLIGPQGWLRGKQVRWQARPCVPTHSGHQGGQD